MMRILTVLILGSFLSACQAQDANKLTPEEATRVKKEVYELARKNNGGKEPTEQDLWKALIQKAKQASGTKYDYGNYRQVKKGAKPEIIVRMDGIEINGTPLKFGGDIEDWKAAIGGSPACEKTQEGKSYYTRCIWHDFGMSIDTVRGSSASVSGFYLQVIKPPEDPYAGLVIELPDGTPVKPLPDYNPKSAFTGYLEIDGYGIDAKTQHWEIEARIDPSREFHCSIYGDCASAHGRGVSMIFSREHIQEVTISEE